MIHGVGVILIRDDGAVLLQHRDEKDDLVNSGLWCYIGGRVEPGEDFASAAIRELREETGYQAQTVHHLLDEVYKRADGLQVCRHIFFVIYDDRQPIKCHEGSEVEFIVERDLAAMALVQDHERIIKRALQASRSMGLLG